MSLLLITLSGYIEIIPGPDKILCNNCHKSYTKYYFAKHSCKTNVNVACNATSSTMSNSADNATYNVASNATANSNVGCSSTNGVKAKIMCNGCGKLFIHINRHKCKINKNKTSFIITSDTNNSFSLFHDSLLTMNTSDLSDPDILDSAFLSQAADTRH